MDDDLDELFGDIQGYVPPECCEPEMPVENSNPVIKNFVVLAHGDSDDRCGDRRFTVNLHQDGSWSFTFSNGEALTQQQINFYCAEIAGAQSKLANERRWEINGRGLGVWDPANNIAGSDGAISDNGTQYQQTGVFNSSLGPSCNIAGPINVNRPI